MSHHEMGSLDPRLADAFAELRAESAAPPRPEVVEAARRAMHLAAAERDHRGLLAVAAERLRRSVTLHRLMAAGSGAAVALATVTALGWNAPAGAPLHVVEVAHERIALAFPGIDRASLDLSYAEARLEQAAAGQAGGDALGEAQSLLDDARSHLPADQGAPLWSRWRSDSARLDQLRGGDEHGGAPGGVATPTPSPRAEDGGRGETQTRTSTSSTTGSRTGDGEGGGSSTSTRTESQSRSSSSGGDGGHDGSQTSTSTSTSSSSSSSSGRDVGVTSTVSTTTSGDH